MIATKLLNNDVLPFECVECDDIQQNTHFGVSNCLSNDASVYSTSSKQNVHIILKYSGNVQNNIELLI